MISSAIWNKQARVNFFKDQHFTTAYLREKSCDYVLTIHMKNYEIAYHYYAEAKRAHQLQK